MLSNRAPGEPAMKISGKIFAFLTVSINLLWLAINTPVFADVNNYEFRLVENETQKGKHIHIAVHLINNITGELIPDAMIFANRIDMSPDGMAAKNAPLAALPSPEPGIYLFRADLAIEGNWQLSLAAMIPDVDGIVEGRMVLKVLP
jgi:hypothetical protein